MEIAHAAIDSDKHDAYHHNRHDEGIGNVCDSEEVSALSDKGLYSRTSLTGNHCKTQKRSSEI